MFKNLGKKIIVGILLNAIALYIVVAFLDQVDYQGGWKFFVLASIIIGLLNTLLRPIIKLVAFPFIVATLGLFLVVINAGLLWLTKELINGLHIADIQFIISGAFTYVIAAIVFGLANWFEHIFIHNQ